jgi:hypothetical protein
MWQECKVPRDLVSDCLDNLYSVGWLVITTDVVHQCEVPIHCEWSWLPSHALQEKSFDREHQQLFLTGPIELLHFPFTYDSLSIGARAKDRSKRPGFEVLHNIALEI